MGMKRRSQGSKKKVSSVRKRSLKMSHIILPMLAQGTFTSAQIADAVIEKFPEQKNRRDVLITQIEGPRTYYIIHRKDLWQGSKKPGVKGKQ
jgi:hypothetical protein